jgi:hypothetical protein
MRRLDGTFPSPRKRFSFCRYTSQCPGLDKAVPRHEVHLVATRETGRAETLRG